MLNQFNCWVYLVYDNDWFVKIITMFGFNVFPISSILFELIFIYFILSIISGLIIYLVSPKLIGKSFFSHFPNNKKTPFTFSHKIIVSFIIGAQVFVVFFLINNVFSSESEMNEYEIKDAYIENFRIKSKFGIRRRACIGIAGNEHESYIFNTKYPKKFNWNFSELEGTEIYKGEKWENYEYEVLKNILLNCTAIKLIIKNGFFGYDIIEHGECIH